MPKKIYISSVSEEATPNVQYIKEFATEIDRYIFVSTEFMQKKQGAEKIIKACKLPDNTYTVLVVNEESMLDIKQKLADVLAQPFFQKTSGYLVNCTLGNKIMALALYDVFQRNPTAQLLYTPIRTNHYRSVQDDSVNEVFKTSLTLEEYINSYRIDIVSQAKPTQTTAYTNEFKQKFLKGFKQDVLERIRLENDGVYQRKGVEISKIDGLMDLLSLLKFQPQTTNELSATEVRYLTGGWLEEWVYHKMKRHLNLKDDVIAISTQVIANGAQNELDVTFLYNNELYIIECKTSISTTDLNKQTIYKAGALAQLFGKNVHAFLFTFGNLRTKNTGKINDNVQKRAEQQKITIADRTTLEKEFTTFLATHFKKSV